MQKKYLALCALGTILPNIFVIKESIETQNYLLYARPLDTLSDMFANNVSSAFMVDLLFIVILFLAWSYQQSKAHDIKGLALVWIYTFALGIAGGLPLFLYLRERRISAG